jgi:hypothetical protein
LVPSSPAKGTLVQCIELTGFLQHAPLASSVGEGLFGFFLPPVDFFIFFVTPAVISLMVCFL